jgi:alpha-tubulin suppressor-like RCC1 family protein
MDRPARWVTTGRLLVLASIGCASDHNPTGVHTAPPPAAIVILAGNNQQGTAGLPLRDSIRIKVTDSTGRPVAHVTTTWVATDSAVIRTVGVTDSNGVVAAQWSLGARLGSTSITVVVANVTPVTVTAVAYLFPGGITAGADHTCAIDINHVAYCWGNNGSGELGDGTTVTRGAPMVVSGAITWSIIVAAGDYTCGVSTGGSAYCWGDNTHGALGTGSTTDATAPAPVSGGASFLSLAANSSHTCGLTSAGVAYCWGDNTWGELGDGTTTMRPSPMAVATTLRFSALIAGTEHTCGLATTGALYCWGALYDWGADSTDVGTTATTPVLALSAPVPAALTSDDFSLCGLAAGGVAECWGSGQNGQLGLNYRTYASGPAPVWGGLAFASLSNGEVSTCGITVAGAAYCWGYNAYGGVGDGTTVQRSVPSAVTSTVAFTAITVGFLHTCGIGPFGAAYCWGLNSAGQLGVSLATTQSLVPVAVQVPVQP